ncbi:MAG: DUF2628 domain-containing protein [Hyphomicrobium sp.]
MPTYTIHEQPDASADRIDRASELLFVKDAFNWMTALFPPLGLAMSRLWLPLVAYLVFVVAGVAGLKALGMGDNAISILVVAVHIYLGFEHATLERWSLENSGWQMLGTVTGKSLDECERRFLESWLPAQPMIATNTGGQGPTAQAWRNPWSSLGQKA